MAESMRWDEGFIAVDWGTTNRRAYRLDEAGRCAGEFEDSKGILSFPDGNFASAIAEIREAAAVLRGVAVRTPLLPAPDAGQDVWLKPEMLQKTWILRKLLYPMDEIEAMEFMLDKMKASKTNLDFFDMMRRGG